MAYYQVVIRHNSNEFVLGEFENEMDAAEFSHRILMVYAESKPRYHQYIYTRKATE